MSLANVSSLNNVPASPLIASAVPVSQSNASDTSASAPLDATTYTPTPVSASDDAAYTYAQPTQSGGSVWAYSNTDAISQQMNSNLSATTLAGRFSSLGAALLSRYANTTDNYTQSVLIPPPPGLLSGKTDPNLAGAVTLDVTTASGSTVEINLKSGDDGSMSVSASSNGTLTPAEQTALSNLAKSFQAAIDGFTGETSGDTAINVSGLLKYDSTQLSSVELKIDLHDESAPSVTLDFQADNTHRSINAALLTGSVDVNVNLNNTSMIGTQAQQDTARQNYLQQFTQEEARDPNNTDPTLMQAFSDSFGQLNSNYPPLMVRSWAVSPSVQSDQDHAMLTGLADFQANVKQNALSPNPLKMSEVDQFNYQMSQQTMISGKDYSDRAITQNQSSSLVASYHKWLQAPPGVPATQLQKKQNYYYEQINDSANATTNIGYQSGQLAQASISKSASQSRHETKYVNENLVEDQTFGASQTETQDLIALLAPLQKDAPTDTEKRARILAAINSQIYLQDDPQQLPFGASLTQAVDAANAAISA